MSEPFNILMVEDDAGHVALVRRSFEHAHQQVHLTVAPTLSEARAYLAEHTPALIITDWLLPDGNGSALLADCGDDLCPVIVMTSYGDEKLAVEAMKAGALDYIVKSGATMLDMPHIVSRALRGWENLCERKRFEQALIVSENKYRNVVENIKEVIFQTDEQDCWTLLNPAWREMTGFSSDECLGRPYWEYILPADRLIDRDQIAKLKAGEALFCKYEVRYMTCEGGFLWMETHVRLARNENSAAQGLIGTLVDRTVRKLVEEQLNETNRKLSDALRDLKSKEQQIIRQERLRALGQMAGGVAHDFNNALQPIMLAAGMLKNDPLVLNDKDAFQTYVRVILKSAKEASGTVNRLVRFFRPNQNQDMSAVDLGALIRDVVDITKPKWKDEAQSQGCTIEIKQELCDACYTMAQRDELSEVLINLIFNAIEAMPCDGSVTLRLYTDGDWAVMEVSDNGMGMSEKDRLSCLEPFYTTKIKRGSGLGLSIVYGVIKGHDGDLDIESMEGKGTTVRIRLHRIVDLADAVAQQHVALETRPVGAFRILVVDDEPALREMLSYALSMFGHQVVTASCGAEGLDYYCQGRYDVVITDQAMPGMPGDQLACKIREVNPKQVIVMLTGFGDLMQSEDHIPEHVDVLLSKPITPHKLNQVIGEIVQQKNKEIDTWNR